MKWFRWHRGTTENPKFALVAELANQPTNVGEDERIRGGVTVTDVIAVWAVILEDAASSEHWGVCIKDARFMAVVLRWHVEEAQQVLDAMLSEGLIGGEPGAITIPKWHEYQYSSDGDPTNAKRQRRHRKRRKKRNGPVTDERTVTERDSAVTVTAKSRPDTDTDTDLSSSLRSEERAPKRSRARIPFPSDWRPVDWSDIEFERFKDHAIANGRLCAGQVGWEAAWRNWKTSPYRRQNGTGHRSAAADRAYELADEWRRREAEISGTPDDAGSPRPGRQAD